MKDMNMKTDSWRFVRTTALLITAAAALAGGVALAQTPGRAAPVPAPAPAKAEPNSLLTEEVKADIKAKDMLNRGLDLIQSGQEDRGLKLVASVPEMFPKSPVRFHAYLAMGRLHMDKSRNELAVKQFQLAADSEDLDEQAEALYQIGVCNYLMNEYDKAFMTLRKVTNDFPWSVFANESYYYIGQCHFKQGRWSKAIEALEMVGTSVPMDLKGDVLAEAGQRLYVKVFDKDLVVLMNEKKKLEITLTTSKGDVEKVKLEQLGRSGEYYIGSLPTEPGEPKSGDGILQFMGPETVLAEYVDENTESGEVSRKVIAKIQLVSSATAGFTDGAFREYTKGVFADKDCFIRVKDLVREAGKDKEPVKVRVLAQYKPERDENAPETEEPQAKVRDAVEVSLSESAPHSGIFVGTVVPKAVAGADAVQNDGSLYVMKGDDLVVEYKNDLNMSGESRLVRADAKLLMGQVQDVKIEHREVDLLDQKARKNLIEAKIYLKLAAIFKDVGLLKNAYAKADEGLIRIEDVISTSLKASLDRSVVEDAFSVKWELLLVQDKLPQAIAVCRTLTQMFPDSSLVDKALLKIGQVRMDGENPTEAVNIFNSVLSLPKSDCKAEAQFLIGKTFEKMATSAEKPQPAMLSRAMLAYKDCSEKYPDSSFAGDSLEKIADYYINTKDYARAAELMERVFQDYPDAGFLDRMLLKWVVVAYRMGNYPLARDKAQQLLAEHPNSKSATKAREFLDVINKKASGGGDAAESKPEAQGESKTDAKADAKTDAKTDAKEEKKSE